MPQIASGPSRHHDGVRVIPAALSEMAVLTGRAVFGGARSTVVTADAAGSIGASDDEDLGRVIISMLQAGREVPNRARKNPHSISSC